MSQYTTLTVSGNNNSNNKLLEALYNHFNGTSTKWQLKAGATHAPASSAAGDQGFILESKGAEPANIVFASQSYFGTGSSAWHQKAVSGTISSADQLIIGLDGGGGVTDITTGNWTVGARWSGWVVDAQGESTGSTITKVRVIEDDSYICIICYDSGEANYDSAWFAGKFESIAAKASGYCLIGGDIDQWHNTSYWDEGAYEAFASQAQWSYMRSTSNNGANYGGFRGNGATDGAGNFEITKLAFAHVQDPVTATSTNWAVIGFCPCIFVGPRSGTEGEAWEDGSSNTIGYNFDGGCYIFADDGVTPW